MKFTLPSRRDWVYGAAVFLLAAVCAVLAFLQYRWIGEVANAEQQRLRSELQRNLTFVQRDFNSQIGTAAAELVPTSAEVERLGCNKAYVDRYFSAEESTQKFFTRVALAVPEDGDLDFFLLDANQKEFRREAWPSSWEKLHEGLITRLTGRQPGPQQYQTEGVVEIPRFGGEPGGPGGDRWPGEQEWLILEFDREYLRSVLLPSLLQRYLLESGEPSYSVIVSETAEPTREVYRWGPKSFGTNERADASVTLFAIEPGLMHRIPERGGREMRPRPEPPEQGPHASGRGAWTLRANHPAGSLESIVAQARRRNLLLAAGLLSLLIVSVLALIRFTRGTEKLAEMQMNFVSGISHELRTPLSVIRAAGFNLSTKFSSQPEQVERYGKLIEGESQKLTALVEQILRYGNVESGRILGAREVLEIQPLLEESLPSTREALALAGITIEEKIETDLPPVQADRESLKHALRNLLENAVKHGGKPNAWVRVTAGRATVSGKSAVRIGIQDNGPGIPKEERELVFQPFFRGRIATANQVRGTGLGLNLAKRIIEAHGGTLTLQSALGKGTEFLVTIPATPAE
jgi:signal transduction histidine kinase